MIIDNGTLINESVLEAANRIIHGEGDEDDNQLVAGAVILIANEEPVSDLPRIV